MSTRELWNRPIVRLDPAGDFIFSEVRVEIRNSLRVLVVFATHLDPHELADEAFLRLSTTNFARMQLRTKTLRSLPA